MGVFHETAFKVKHTNHHTELVARLSSRFSGSRVLLISGITPVIIGERQRVGGQAVTY